MNVVILVGRTGGDAEVRDVGEGKKMSFSLATSKRFKNKAGERVEQVTWHNIAMWGERAEKLAEYIKKGMRIGVKGEISTRSYEKDGEKKFITEIVADDIELLESKEEGTRSNDGARSSGGNQASGRSSSRGSSSGNGARASSSGGGKSSKSGKAEAPAEPFDGEPGGDDIPF